MRIYPAIDIKEGKVVRLVRGDYGRVTVFEDDPVKVAGDWQEQGASFIHVVDLDGARYGEARSDDVIKAMLGEISVPIQVGGGIRTLSDIDRKIKLGVSRVILGSAAVSDKEIVREAVRLYGEKIAVGIDAKNGMAATDGWERVSSVPAVELALEMSELGVETVIYTDIDKDGMMMGPNIPATKEMAGLASMRVIASGGVTRMGDLENLSHIGVEGVIIGRALYTGALRLSEIIRKYEKAADPK